MTSKNYDLAVALRHTLHTHPELSHQETWTKSYLMDFLAQHTHLEVVDQGKWFYALYRAEQPRGRIAFRADFDALPIQEDLPLPYCSQCSGVSHKCGHDGHSAALAALALDLEENGADQDVYLIFQHAEEVGGGAGEIVEYLKQKGGVDGVIGTHLDGGSDAGVIHLPDGPLMAGAQLFEIEVKGVGGHGSRPDKAVDPVKPACDILLKIASIPAQYHNPFDTCVVSPCQIHGGSASNIIPESVKIGGNLRFFKYGDDEKLLERIRLVAENTAKAYGTTATVSNVAASPLPVINNPEMAALGREVAASVGFTFAPPHDPTCGSDNYAEFLAAFPGFYCDTGANCKRPGTSGNHHNPTFDLDESAFRRIVEFFAAFAVRFLGE